MKIVFFGTSDFVTPVRDILKYKFDLVASFNSPDQKIDKENLLKLNPDLFLVASFGKILKKEILDIPKYGAVNLHPSLLPKYRGASPIQSAILNGDKKTGLTIIKMDEEMDHGPILFQKEEEIKTEDTFETLVTRLFKIGADNLANVITKYSEDKLETAPQNDSEATFTKLINKNDGQIDLNNLPAKEKLERMIRAYYPWPGVFFKTELSNQNKIIKLLPSGVIQVEGKKPMSYKDFINGYKEGSEILKSLSLN